MRMVILADAVEWRNSGLRTDRQILYDPTYRQPVCVQDGMGDRELKAKPVLNINGVENPIGLPLLQMLQAPATSKR